MNFLITVYALVLLFYHVIILPCFKWTSIIFYQSSWFIHDFYHECCVLSFDGFPTTTSSAWSCFSIVLVCMRRRYLWWTEAFAASLIWTRSSAGRDIKCERISRNAFTPHLQSWQTILWDYVLMFQRVLMECDNCQHN